MFSLTVFIGSAMHFQDARSFDVCLIPSFLGIVFGAAFHRGVFIFELCMYFMGERKRSLDGVAGVTAGLCLVILGAAIRSLLLLPDIDISNCYCIHLSFSSYGLHIYECVGWSVLHRLKRIEIFRSLDLSMMRNQPSNRLGDK